MAAARTGILAGAGALVLGAAGWFVLGRGADPDAPPPPPEHVVPAEDVFALLVGCTEYPRLKAVMSPEAYEGRIRLLGPENDVALLRQVLHDYLGVPDAHVVTLAGWPDDPAARPTRANILGHLDRLAREVPRGARVVFHFAGHGSQQPDEPGGDEPDRLDEILLPSDADRWGSGATTVPGAITDDELRARLVALRDAGATVWAILDCCHAGTMVRGPGDAARMRELSPEDLGIPRSAAAPAARGAATESVGLLAEQGGALEGIAACYAVQSWQQAPEMMLPQRSGARNREAHGLFSFLLARTIQRYGGTLTLAELHQHVLAAYGEMPYSAATPLAEGDLSQRVLPGAVPGGAVVVVRREGGRLVLDAGSLRGLTVGTVLEVFRPGGLGTADARLGTLRIEEVQPLSAVCGAVPGERALTTAEVPDRAPCRVLTVAAGEHSLRLAIVDDAGVALEPSRWPPALREALADPVRRARFPPASPGEAGWRLRVGVPDPVRPQAGPQLFLEPLGGSEAPPLEVASDELPEVLDRLYRAEALRRLARADVLGAPLPGLKIEGLRRRFGTAELEPLEPGASVPPGDRLAVRVTNGTGQDVDVAVLSIDSSYAVSHAWPRGSGSVRLTATENDPLVFGPVPLTDDGAGLESLLVIVATRKEGAAPLDVGDLSKPPLQGVQGTTGAAGAQALARDLAFGGSGARGGPEGAGTTLTLHEVRWKTDWGRMGTPSTLNDGAVALDPPLPSGPAAGPDEAPPGGGIAWSHARVVKGENGAADVLLLWGERAIRILVDEDGDAGMNEADTASLARRAVEGTLPVEVAVLLSGSTRSTALATGSGDGGLDVVLVDSDGDGQAERRWLRSGGAWTSRAARGAWLSTLYVRPAWDAPRARMVSALRRFSKAQR